MVLFSLSDRPCYKLDGSKIALVFIIFLYLISTYFACLFSKNKPKNIAFDIGIIFFLTRAVTSFIFVEKFLEKILSHFEKEEEEFFLAPKGNFFLLHEN